MEAQDVYNGDMFVLMLATGLRVGEAMALTWDDIDFEEGTLSVNKSLMEFHDYDTGKKHMAINPPKTKSSTRVIPLLPNIIEMMKEKKENDNPNDKNLLYTSRNGELIPYNSVRGCFKRILLLLTYHTPKKVVTIQTPKKHDEKCVIISKRVMQ